MGCFGLHERLLQGMGVGHQLVINVGSLTYISTKVTVSIAIKYILNWRIRNRRSLNSQ